MKHNNAEEKRTHPFSFSLKKSDQVFEQFFTISFNHVENLSAIPPSILTWSIIIAPLSYRLFYLNENNSVLVEDASVGFLILIFLFLAFVSLIGFMSLTSSLSILIPYAFAFTKNLRNIKLLINGIGTEATFVKVIRVARRQDSLASKQLQFSYFTEDGAYQTLTLPSAALSDIDKLQPGDKKLLLYLPKDPAKGILYDLIPFAPTIDPDTGEFIAPNMKDFKKNKRSIVWMIMYVLYLVWLMILTIGNLSLLVALFLLFFLFLGKE